MARDQVITRDQIAVALTAYCKDHENSSFAEAVDGDKKFRFMSEGTPGDKDVQIWELNGKLKEIAATLDEESNPIIMLAKYKK